LSRETTNMSDDLLGGTAGSLLSFLDYSAAKGLLNARTAGARKSACVKVLEIDGPNWRDRKIGEIDVDDQIDRFSRKAGGRYSPGSLTTYAQRFRDALTEYTEYLSNPQGYRGPRARRAPTRPKPSDERASRKGEQKPAPSPANAADADLITYPFPLAQGRLGYVQLPREFVADDAERLCHFIRSLAIQTASGTERKG
jgi:hypothetical protein